MSLFEPESFESFTLSLPGVSLVDQWGSRVAKVGGKVFTLLRLTSPDLHSIVFKCPKESFVVLTGIEGVKQAPYFAKGQWVCVPREADLSNAELQAYLRRSYQLVAAGLTKKLRQELVSLSNNVSDSIGPKAALGRKAKDHFGEAPECQEMARA